MESSSEQQEKVVLVAGAIGLLNVVARFFLVALLTTEFGRFTTQRIT